MDKNLFNKKTLIKNIAKIEEPTAKQKKASKRWIELLEKNQLQEEVSNYPKFMIYILKDLLGYDITDFKHEEKNMEFPFKDKSGNFLVCFEAKGTKTKDLWAPQGRNTELRKTPVIQVNNYMYEKKIPYGVLTNYREFVLFKREEGYTKYHKIDFLDIKKNPDKLKEFIFIFSKESFEEEKTDKLYKDSIVEERNLTKEFYKLYHETRLMILKEFKESEIENEVCLHYAQLFLNRLMFIFFAEDTDLLDKRYFEIKILEVLEKSGGIDGHTKYVFGKIKSIFRELDKEIPRQIKGFNGELFKEEIDGRLSFKDYRNKPFFNEGKQNYKLDKKIELYENDKKIFNKHKNRLNPIIKNILLMASYDFKSEVNVNILGHIFEQSISDIENLKEEKISKRKKEGVFYTPEYITEYICRNTIIPYLSKNGINDINELIDEYSDNIEELEKKFKSIKILDPACGSGAFLIKSTEILFEIFEKIQFVKENYGDYGASRGLKRKSNFKGQLTLKKFDEKEEIKNIIENNIYGVDINEESVEITKLSLFLKIARKNRKLIDLSSNIKQGNSLVSDEKIDKKAFNWEKEFPFKFDVVIGNPPYVKARDYENTRFRKYIESKYSTAYKMWDLYIPFIENGLNLLKDNGNLSMIIPDTIGKADYTSKIVDLIESKYHLYQIDFFPEVYIFDKVGVKNKIIFVKNESESDNCLRIKHGKIISDLKKLKSIEDKEKYLYETSKIKINLDNTRPLEDICLVSYGLRLNSDKHDKKYKFKKEDLLSDKINDVNNKLFIEGKYLEPYAITKERYVEWGTKRCPKKLVRATFPELYKPEKLLMSRQKRITAYSNKGHICDNTIIVGVLVKDLEGINNKNLDKYFKNINKDRKDLEQTSKRFKLKYLLSILNSRLIKYFLKYNSGGKIDSYPDDWKKIPIKKISPEEQKPFIEKSNFMIDKNKKFYEAKKKFIKLIKYKYNLDKISRKLNNFYNLDFKEFIKEIQNKNKIMSIEKESELMDFFEKNKNEVLKLVNEISQTGKELDQKVYKLYGITDEEKEIIEKH